MTAAPGAARVFHILGADRWPAEGNRQVVAAEQFERHGFVHCCFREQLAEIATWWFDAGDDLVALELDPSRISAPVRMEASPTRWYPHVYGPLDRAAVMAHHAIPRTPDGVAELPMALASPPPAYRVVGRRGDAAGVAVRWQAGALTGDPGWVADAHRVVAEGVQVALVGGVVVPATLATPYESFTLLVELADELLAYEGDGFGGAAR